MARAASRYVCQSCGAVSTVWEGRCHLCGTWDSLVETVAPASARSSRGHLSGSPAAGQRCPDPCVRSPPPCPTPERRHRGGRSGTGWWPRAGRPGAAGRGARIGKSTLVLEIAAGVARATAPGIADAGEGTDVLYASGEESADQLHLRADRLGLTAGVPGTRIQVLAETGLDAVLAAAERLRPSLLVVDSVQTLTAAGSRARPDRWARSGNLPHGWRPGHTTRARP